MTDKEIIRAEVEKLYNKSLEDNIRQSDSGLKGAASLSYGKAKACKELLSFIDSMQEDNKFDAAIQEGDDVRYNEDLGCRVNLSHLKRVAKKEEYVSDDLEDELYIWRHNHFHGRRDDKGANGEYLERTSQLDLARHFAEWQKAQEAKYREENNICCMKFDDIEDARKEAYEQGRNDQRTEDGKLIARAHFQGMDKMKEMMEREPAADLETAIEQYKSTFNTNCGDQQLFHIARWFTDYGAWWQKQQMMNDAVTAEWGYGSFALPDDFKKTLKYGDKLIIIKEE